MKAEVVATELQATTTAAATPVMLAMLIITTAMSVSIKVHKIPPTACVSTQKSFYIKQPFQKVKKRKLTIHGTNGSNGRFPIHRYAPVSKKPSNFED